jgi:hypothetical protein
VRSLYNTVAVGNAEVLDRSVEHVIGADVVVVVVVVDVSVSVGSAEGGPVRVKSEGSGPEGAPDSEEVSVVLSDEAVGSTITVGSSDGATVSLVVDVVVCELGLGY